MSMRLVVKMMAVYTTIPHSNTPYCCPFSSGEAPE